MARPLRLEYPGAVVYVSGRTRGRTVAFRDGRDRERFLALLGTVGPEERWRIHGYSVRRDGYELLIETPASGLSHGMRSLIGRYTQLFNRRYGREGRLFEGRFRSVLVQKEAYLRDLARHIAWSPVREGLARRPEGWRWSSFAATAREGTTPRWLESDGQRGAAYRRFVAGGSGAPSPLESVVKSAYLGDAGFVRKAKALLASGAYRKKVRRRSRLSGDVNLRQIRATVAREWGVPPASLQRHGGEPKVAGIYLARKLTPLSNIEIGEAFGVGEARVSSAMRQVREGSKRSLVPRLEELRTKLSRQR
jgi:REP element-mobilizing transposase RayT